MQTRTGRDTLGHYATLSGSLMQAEGRKSGIHGRNPDCARKLRFIRTTLTIRLGYPDKPAVQRLSSKCR